MAIKWRGYPYVVNPRVKTIWHRCCYNTQMLPKQHRFSSRTEIRRVFRSAVRKHSNSFIWLSSRPSNRINLPWRAAVIVSKKVAPLATDRNAIRRKISEVLWQQKELFPSGIDIIILAQRQEKTSKFLTLIQEITSNIK